MSIFYLLAYDIVMVFYALKGNLCGNLALLVVTSIRIY